MLPWISLRPMDTFDGLDQESWKSLIFLGRDDSNSRRIFETRTISYVNMPCEDKGLLGIIEFKDDQTTMSQKDMS
jgi:hypothetical protein